MTSSEKFAAKITPFCEINANYDIILFSFNARSELSSRFDKNEFRAAIFAFNFSYINERGSLFSTVSASVLCCSFNSALSNVVLMPLPYRVYFLSARFCFIFVYLSHMIAFQRRLSHFYAWCSRFSSAANDLELIQYLFLRFAQGHRNIRNLFFLNLRDCLICFFWRSSASIIPVFSLIFAEFCDFLR